MSSTGTPDAPDPVEALERLGRVGLRENCMRSLLQAVADLAREVMPGDPETSVSLLINHRSPTAVFTGGLARPLDQRPYRPGVGPLLHAARTRRGVETLVPR